MGDRWKHPDPVARSGAGKCGRDDAVGSVRSPTGTPDEVRVHIGTGTANSPCSPGIPLGTQDGTDERGLDVDSADLRDGVLVVPSFGCGAGDLDDGACLLVTGRFRWNGSASGRGGRAVGPVW